jgi:nucleotide-binding universal stress UspA family protein
VLHSDRPVLVVPYTGHFSSVATKVVIAWDGSKEAMQAVVASIPFLQKAEEVRVVIYDPTAEQKEREPHIGNELAKYLARFDINVEILIQVSSRGLGNSLLSFAADCSADLIVMGAFVHSRYREMFLGGMTNTMLSDMTIPVLFAH